MLHITSSERACNIFTNRIELLTSYMLPPFCIVALDVQHLPSFTFLGDLQIDR